MAVPISDTIPGTHQSHYCPREVHMALGAALDQRKDDINVGEAKRVGISPP